MKIKILIVAVVIGGISLGGFLLYQPAIAKYNELVYFSYCDIPITYKVGFIDPKFGVSKENFVEDINQGAAIWSSIWGKPLFVYNSGGDLTINLVYDQRQYLRNQINSLENKLDQEDQSLQPQVAEYNQKSKDFQTKLDKFTQSVDYWNTQGGAPPEEYERLIKEQQELQQEADSLNALALKLNQQAGSYNLEIGNLKNTVNRFNDALKYKPEEGLFIPGENKIEIYFTDNQNELIHTLAHELGHALTLPHVNDQAAIMFEQTTEKLTPSQKDVDALNDYCQTRNKLVILWQTLKERMNLLVIRYQQLFNQLLN